MYLYMDILHRDCILWLGHVSRTLLRKFLILIQSIKQQVLPRLLKGWLLPGRIHLKLFCPLTLLNAWHLPTLADGRRWSSCFQACTLQHDGRHKKKSGQEMLPLVWGCCLIGVILGQKNDSQKLCSYRLWYCRRLAWLFINLISIRTLTACN